MYRDGHYGVSLILYAAVIVAADAVGLFGIGLIGLGVVLFVTPLPDMDLNVSFLKHRGFTHTVWFALLVGAVVAVPVSLAYTVLQNPEILETGLSVANLTSQATVYVFAGSFLSASFGIISHILGDVITPMGIRPFRKPNRLFPDLPIFTTRKYTLDLFYAKNQLANTGLLISGCLLTGAAIILSLSSL